MKTYAIATIPGDGIGKEVIPAGQQVLQVLAQTQGGLAFEFETFGWGGDWYRAHGEMMPADGLDALRGKDAILFGSAGDPHIPDHITLWGLRLKICQGFDQYANVSIGNSNDLLKPDRPWVNLTPPLDPGLAHPSTA